MISMQCMDREPTTRQLIDTCCEGRTPPLQGRPTRRHLCRP